MKPFRFRFRAVFTLAGVLFLLGAPRSEATVRTWTGLGVDNHWTTPGNWSGSVAPVPGDSLSFPWMTSSVSNFNSYADGTTFNEIFVSTSANLTTASGYTFGGNRLILSNGISVVTGLLMVYSNAGVNVDCNITLGTNQMFSATSPLNINGSVDGNGYVLTFGNSGSININGTVTNSRPGLVAYDVVKTNTGTLTISSAAHLDIQSVAVKQGVLVMNGMATNSYFVVTNGSMVLDGQVHYAEADYGGVVSGTGDASYLQGDGAGGVFSPGDSNGPGVLMCDYFYPIPNEAFVFPPAPGIFQVNINGTTPGTGYSQLRVTTDYALSYVFFNGVNDFIISENLDVNVNYASQIGDSFLILRALSGLPYDPNPNYGNGMFAGLPSGSIYDSANGWSFGVSYDTDGVTLTTARAPTSPFVLWKGSGDASTLSYENRYWSSTNNWALGLVPGTGSHVQFTKYQYSYAAYAMLPPPLTNDLSSGTSLASFLFTGTNYALYGNAITITEGITNQISAGTNFCYLDVAASGLLTFEADTGGMFVLGGTLAGSGTVSKEGGGTLQYTGTTMDSFVGTVVVDKGTLQVDGSFTDGSFTVNGGLLDGIGTVSSVSVNGGTLKPGDSPGILHIQGDLNMSAGAVFEAELNGPIPGTSYDQLQVNGGVNLTGATLNLQPGYAAGPGAAFLILVNDGTDPIVGTFAGLPEGAVFSAGGQYFSISYKAGSGNNDVVVTAVSPPGNFKDITLLNANTAQLQGLGASNVTYTIQANTNLATTNWVNIGTAPADGSGAFFFNDTNVLSYPQRFFRILTP